jgi:hypothetical protein
VTVDDSPVIARHLARASKMLRKNLEDVFAAEVARADASADLMEALDLCASWEAWDRLRNQQRLSASAARRVLAATMHSLLDPFETEDRS